MPGMLPGSYLEYDFPGYEVAQLARKEMAARRPVNSLERWWGRRLGSLWRSVLLAGLVSWNDWMGLEARGGDANSDSAAHPSWISAPLGDEWQRRSGKPEVERPTPTRARFDHPPGAWQRLYYRLDEEAGRVIERAARNKLIVHLWMTSSTLVQESLRLGVDVLGAVHDPTAWFSIRQASDGMLITDLQRAAQTAKACAADDVRDLYRTTCPICGQPIEWDYVVWARLARCPTPGCAVEIPLYTSFVLNKAGCNKAKQRLGVSSTWIAVCPACGEVYPISEGVSTGSSCPACGSSAHVPSLHMGYVTGNDFTCPQCETRHAIPDGVRAYGRPRYRMVALSASCANCAWRGYKRVSAEDRALFEQAHQRWRTEQAELRLLEQELPGERPGLSRLAQYGITRWTELFNERQLLLVSRLREAILKVTDDEAREYLLLAWSGFLEHHTMLASYQPGSGRIGNAFGPRGAMPPCMCAEHNPWVEVKAGHSFSVQLARLEDYLKWARRPEEPLVRNGRAIRVGVGDSLWPRRSVRTLLCRSSEQPQALFEGRQADLIVVDLTDDDHQALAAQLSEFFYVWLRSSLAPDYPVIFGRSAMPRTNGLLTSEALTHTLTGAADCLTNNGLLVLACQQPVAHSWVKTLQPVVSAGLVIKAIHPVFLKEIPASIIPDWATLNCLALVVCGRPARKTEPSDWHQVREDIAQLAAHSVTQLSDQVSERHFSAPDIFVITLGRCLAEYTRYFHRGRPFVFWQDQPVSPAQALDGDKTLGIQGIMECLEQLLERAEVQRWPAGLDPLSQLYLTTLLGQSYVLRTRLEARLVLYPGLSLETLEAHRLVRCAGDRVRVLPELKRQPFLTDEWHRVTKLTHEGLRMIDRLHLLALAAQHGELAGMLAQGWTGDPLLAELVRLMAMRLPAKHSSRGLYQQVSEALLDAVRL